MAWIYLIITLLVFYLPGVGLGAWLVGRDYRIFSIPVPFSGAVQLMVVSLFVWYVLWRATVEVEKQTGADFLSEIDAATGLNLRSRWLYARKPALIHRFSRYLADTLIVLATVKLVGVVLAAFLLSFGFRWLVARIPVLAATNSWQALTFASLTQLTKSVGDILATWRVYAKWVSIALLVATASRGMDAERRYRYERELDKEQNKRKHHQADIEVSASGRD